jgi:hypothetical protein
LATLSTGYVWSILLAPAQLQDQNLTWRQPNQFREDVGQAITTALNMTADGTCCLARVLDGGYTPVLPASLRVALRLLENLQAVLKTYLIRTAPLNTKDWPRELAAWDRQLRANKNDSVRGRLTRAFVLVVEDVIRLLKSEEMEAARKTGDGEVKED